MAGFAGDRQSGKVASVTSTATMDSASTRVVGNTTRALCPFPTSKTTNMPRLEAHPEAKEAIRRGVENGNVVIEATWV
jgi:hypothetical protein